MPAYAGMTAPIVLSSQANVIPAQAGIQFRPCVGAVSIPRGVRKHEAALERGYS
jgi:hypothetical protein